MHSNEHYPLGEDHGLDLRRSFAKHVNSILKKIDNDQTVIDLGAGYGEFPANKIRLRDALEDGHLRLYVRQEAKDPKVVLPAIIALGLVAAGIYNLKYRK